MLDADADRVYEDIVDLDLFGLCQDIPGSVLQVLITLCVPNVTLQGRTLLLAFTNVWP